MMSPASGHAVLGFAARRDSMEKIRPHLAMRPCTPTQGPAALEGVDPYPALPGVPTRRNIPLLIDRRAFYFLQNFFAADLVRMTGLQSID